MVPRHWGRRLPNFVGYDADGRRFEYHRDVVRGPTVFVAGCETPAVEAVVEATVATLGRRATVVVLGTGRYGDARVIGDPDGRIRAAVFSDDEGGLLLADADQRVIARAAPDAAGIALLAAALDTLARPPSAEHRSMAPVMLLPYLLDPAARGRLIAAFEAGKQEGTIAMLDADGRPQHVERPDRKRRLDLTLEHDGPLYGEVRAAIAERLMPELWKAWWVERLRTEAFYVACYQAERRDFFATHRDNNLPNTAHRRLAVSIELNDDYEGGGLVFPEYSDDRWRAPAGGGLVFSCSLLHEAVPVTAGRRYVLLAFLAAPH